MDIFWIRVGLSFLFAATIVVIATVVGERMGTKLGGIIGTMPTTIIVALYFIGLTSSPAYIAEVTINIPVTMGANAIFLFIYYRTAKWDIRWAPFMSLGAWAALVMPFILFDMGSIWISVLLSAVMVAFAWYGFEYHTDLSSMRQGRMRYTPIMLGSRGLLAGTIIALAVILARYTGPYVGGVISVFPAIYFSTMVIYTRAHGVEYAGSMGRTMTLGGSSVTTYAVVAHFAFPAYGLEVGTVLSFTIGALVTLCLYPILRRVR